VGLSAGKDSAKSRPRCADKSAQAIGHGVAEAGKAIPVERRNLCAKILHDQGVASAIRVLPMW
jgi:hypothetical protein